MATYRYPIVPIDDELQQLDMDDFNSFGKSEVVQYLNEVLEYYGPPCEFCRHFDMFCTLKIRNTKYDLRIGPYESWHIRKFCESHEGVDNSDQQDEERARMVRNQLSCDAQTYGTGS